MGWPSSPNYYLRKGAVQNTGAVLGYVQSGTIYPAGFDTDTSACWYEVGYGLDSDLAIVTAHYRFVPTSSPFGNWPSDLGSGEFRFNLPVTPTSTPSLTFIGTWYVTTYWGFGADGLVESIPSNSHGKLWVRNASGTAAGIDKNNVASIASQTWSDFYASVQYEAA